MIRKQDDVVGTLFQDVAHLIRQKIDVRLRPYGLTRLKWLAIGIIDGDPGLTQTELAKKLELKNAATGKLIERLIKRGLVRRKPDPQDKRIYRLEISEKSQCLLEELKPVGNAIRDDVLQGIDDDECRQLERTLKKIKARLVSGLVFGTAAAFQSETAMHWLHLVPSA